MKYTFLFALLMCAVFPTAQTANPPSSELFEKIKALKGTWVGHSERGGDATLEYRVAGRGSVVLEEYAETGPNPDVMETLYYLEDGQLMLRHYCVAKNQPRMKLAGFDQKANKLRFEFVDGVNIKPADGHMHEIVLQFVDADTLVNGATYYKENKPFFSEATTYKRKTK